MRKLWYFIPLFILSLCGAMLLHAAAPTQFLWDYDFTQPSSRACSSTATVSCVSGFTVQTVVQPAFTVIAGPVSVALPATISTTGPTVGISAPFTPPAAMGNYQIWVTVNWKDGSGTAQSGPTSALGFAVIPVAASNLRTQ